MTTPIPSTNHPDVVLIGAGIMSATLVVILKELDPSLKIELYEVLGSEAQESSNAWNNAGTGHAALCELNYTPQNSDGSIDISKALQVNTEFVYGKASVGSPPNVCPTSGYTARRRKGFSALWTLRGFFHKVSQAWFISRSLWLHRSGKPAAAAGGRQG